jgi:hypothetical protein
MKNKKPDLVVWNEDSGYDAGVKPYPTNLDAPKFELPQVDLIKTEAAKKMIDVFEREKQQILEKIEILYQEYRDSLLVWESKMSFDPIVGKTYYLYNFNGVNTLSLLSPEDWNKKECFINGFILSSDRKWIRIKNEK